MRNLCKTVEEVESTCGSWWIFKASFSPRYVLCKRREWKTELKDKKTGKITETPNWDYVRRWEGDSLDGAVRYAEQHHETTQQPLEWK